MSDDKKMPTWVRLTTALSVAGSDLIEASGRLTGFVYCERPILPHHLNDVRAAISKAQRALAAYEYHSALGASSLSHAEFYQVPTDGARQA